MVRLMFICIIRLILPVVIQGLLAFSRQNLQQALLYLAPPFLQGRLAKIKVFGPRVVSLKLRIMC